MKNLRLSGLLLLCLWSIQLYACDACGCSILFMDMGITPRYQQHQLGLQWQHQRYQSYATQADLSAGTIGSQEYIHFLSLQGQWLLHPRWRVNAQVPYAFLQRKVGPNSQTQQGLSDISALVQFIALNQENKSTQELRHRLTLGVGTKAPTGEYQQSNEVVDPTTNPNFRLGTGSWDLLLNAQYVVRYQRWGGSADAMYSRSGTNPDDYQFGNRWRTSVQLFGVFSQNKVGIMPQLGWSVEQAAQDVERGFYRNATGGHYHFLRPGIQFFLPRFSFQLQHQLPLAQHWADGLTQANGRWTIQWNFFW